MNAIGRLIGSRALALAFGLSLLASGAGAAPISYSTSGRISPWQAGDPSKPGYEGENVIRFVGVTGGSFVDASSSFPLGHFQMGPLPPGQLTYYNNAEF